MLDREKSRLIIQCTGDAPLGKFMREFWIPVIRADQLQPGGAPHRLMILGQKLVAFRSPSGQVGIMDDACPHRGASMELARNEPNGLCCIYHGWKVAADGMVCDAPTHPDNFPLARLKTRSHPVREQQGMVWTWFGTGTPPTFRELAFTSLPDNQVITATADETTLLWSVIFNTNGPLQESGHGLSNLGRLADRNDLFNNLKSGSCRHAGNRWHQNREAMERGESFFGYDESVPALTLLVEDNYVLESQGDYDKSRELLGPVDRALVEGRHVLLDAVTAHQAGEPPQGRDTAIAEVLAGYHLNETAPPVGAEN